VDRSQNTSPSPKPKSTPSKPQPGKQGKKQKPAAAGLEQDRAFSQEGLDQLVALGADPESIEEFLAWRRHRERQRMPLEDVRPSKTSPAKS